VRSICDMLPWSLMTAGRGTGGCWFDLSRWSLWAWASPVSQWLLRSTSWKSTLSQFDRKTRTFLFLLAASARKWDLRAARSEIRRNLHGTTTYSWTSRSGMSSKKLEGATVRSVGSRAARSSSLPRLPPLPPWTVT